MMLPRIFLSMDFPTAQATLGGLTCRTGLVETGETPRYLRINAHTENPRVGSSISPLATIPSADAQITRT